MNLLSSVEASLSLLPHTSSFSFNLDGFNCSLMELAFGDADNDKNVNIIAMMQEYFRHREHIRQLTYSIEATSRDLDVVEKQL